MLSDLMDIEKNRIRGVVMYAELKSRELLSDIERYRIEKFFIVGDKCHPSLDFGSGGSLMIKRPFLFRENKYQPINLDGMVRVFGDGVFRIIIGREIILLPLFEHNRRLHTVRINPIPFSGISK